MTTTTTTTSNATQSSVLDLDNKHINSYVAEATLRRMMERDEINKVRHLVCKTPSGRWTAIVLGFQQHLIGTGWAMVG